MARLRQEGSADTAPVVFVAQWATTFELVDPVVRALQTRGVPVAVAVTPDRRREGDYDDAGAQRLCDWLRAQGHDPLPLVPADREADRLRSLRPSAVFLPTPYEAQRHPDLTPQRLDLPVHFVNYCLRISPDIATIGSPTRHDFYDACEAVYLESAHERELFLASGIAPDQLVLTGHPGLDVWDTPHELAARPTVLWCPWWGHRLSDGSPGYSTFAEGHRAMLHEVRSRPGVDFVFRPHPMMLALMLREGRWHEVDERRFLEEVEALPNISYSDADEVGHVAQFGSAWAMVTDGITFFPEFAATGKPLLLTEAPGNPGWNPIGQALQAVVQTSHLMDGLPDFLDRVEQGIDPVEVSQRKARVRAILGRGPRPSAELIADHVVARREARLRIVAGRRGGQGASRPQARLDDDLVASLRDLNDETAAGPRSYQRALMSTGLLELAGRATPATSVPLPAGAGGTHLIATGDAPADPVLVTSGSSEGWAISHAVVGADAFAASGERLGPVAEVLGGHVARRADWARGLPWAWRRQLRLGTGSVWADLWNQLPAVVAWEGPLAELVADGRVVAGVDASGRGPVESLGPPAALLPALADALAQPCRRVGGPGAVPLGSTRVSAEARCRVRASLAEVPVPEARGPRLWLGVVPGDADAPDDAAMALAAVGAAWCGQTGGDVVVDAFVPDEVERGQWWRADAIAAADDARARLAGAIGEAGGHDVLTTSGISLRQALAWAGTADAFLCCPGEALQRMTWLWDVPGLMMVAPFEHRASVAQWYATQVEGGRAAGLVDSDLLEAVDRGAVERESPYRVRDPKGLATQVLALAASGGEG